MRRFTGDRDTGWPGQLRVAPSGEGFTSIASAVARITQAGLTGNIAISVAAGAYTESFTLPDGTTLTADGPVTVTGTITLAGAATLIGIDVVAPAGTTGIDADQSGAGTTNAVVLIDCTVTASGGGIALLASAVTLTVCNGLGVAAPGATGISLLAGDAVGERTRLIADRLELSGTAVTVGLVTADGVGGDDRVWVQVEAMTLLCDGGSVGVSWGATGAPAEGFPNGAFIGHMSCVPQAAGAANTFFQSVAPNSNHRIGDMDGVVVADVLLDWDAGTGTVEEVNFPDDGVTKTTFQVVDIAGGELTIQSGRLRGGTSPLFSMTGDATLHVYDVDVESIEDGGQVVSAVAADVLTSAAQLNTRGGLWRVTTTAVAVLWQGGASPPALTMQQTRINKNGAADLLQFQNADVILIDVNFRMNTSSHDVVNFTAAAIACSMQWKGYNFFDMRDGGVGRAITVVNDANAGLIDDGWLYVTRAAVGELFDVGALVALTRRGPAQEVVVGFIGTAAAIDVVGGSGVGPPGGTRSVRILTTVYCGKTGTGADDSLTVTVENETTGASSTAVIANAGVGARDFQAIALAAAVLHGPGQPLRLGLALTGGGTPTDVRLAVG